MDSFQNIITKLDQFTRRYYSRVLLKGSLLFVCLGLIFLLVILAVEYFLWLGSNGRLLLLVIFIGVELFLLFRYILTPLFYLIRLKKGIGHKEASVLIGRHFPEVGDKLYNLLDLAESPARSELLLASIAQRSENLKPVPFANAIDFKEALKYAKYSIIPIFILLIIWFSGNLTAFFGSYTRVVNFDLAYEAPAPFSFKLMNPDLNVFENSPVTLQLRTEGKVRPENVFLVQNGKQFLMRENNGIHTHVLEPPLKAQDLYFISNGIKSRAYHLNVMNVPVIQEFELQLEFPKYLERASETVKGTGNATVPEGTKINWRIQGREVTAINWKSADTSLSFSKEADVFKLSRRIYKDMAYRVSTSNENVTSFETLAYDLAVIKDATPSIRAREIRDSLDPNVAYYTGEVMDDHKVTQLTLVYYPTADSENRQRLPLANPNANFDKFYYTFPSGLDLEQGVSYSYYFEVKDNDAIHNGKTAQSEVFGMHLLNNDQIRNEELQYQQSVIQNMDKTLERSKEQQKSFRTLNKEQKEKNNLSFSDKAQIKDFLQQQEQQEELMQKFSKQLKENLQKSDQDSELNKMLQERLERQEMEAKKNERLLEELNKIADKINKEDLTERLEEMAKKQQNSDRNLEQLLELTKRYYVTEKASQLAKDLEALAKLQKELSETKKDSTSSPEQQKLNSEFDQLGKELEDLKKDDGALKKPLGLPIEKEKQEEIRQEQQQALEQLKELTKPENGSKSDGKQKAATKASQKQRSASEKMKQMSESLDSSPAAAGGGSQISEDAKMLRQILDNLITFSFKQEKLYETLETADMEVFNTSATIREQQELKGLFEHVDDSLFALSLRRAELSEFVNEQITEIYYNMDKVLENLAESKTYPSQSHQQYIITASNSLADFLANILDNMQQSMQAGSGSGSGNKGFQLPDIIKGQGELKDKMGKLGESGEGKAGEQGKSKGADGEGQGTEKGKKGTEGKSGDDGNGNRQNNTGKTGEGQGQGNEEQLQQLYEIYKQQQLLREQLQQEFQEMLKKEDRELAQKLIKQMEDFENDLLENGITKRGMEKANHIQHELMKLENAVLKQGNKTERKSNVNTRNFTNPITTKPPLFENYENDVEILNRQALPLQQLYQEKVKNYFKENDPVPF